MSKNLKVLIEKTILKILPPPIPRLIGFIFGLLYKKKSYSQFGEDLIVWNYFHRAGIQKGVYLDIGSFHPKWISNTHILHLQGWSGYAVDIDEFKMKAFSFMRKKKITTICAAITDEQGQGTVSVYKFNRLWSEIDTLSEAVAQDYQKLTGFSFYNSTIRAISIDDLLKIVGHVNFINIDIEGLDELIVLKLNLKSNGPEVVVFEDNNFWGGSEKILRYMEDAGYVHLFTSQGSTGFCKPLKTHAKYKEPSLV